MSRCIGIGVDIVKIDRIARLIQDVNFINRVFTKNEVAWAGQKNKSHYFAKRFAAKEAVVKALGTGFTRGISFKSIEVDNDDYGKPQINLDDNVISILNLRNYDIQLSLSDEVNYSVAFVLIQEL